MFATNSTIHYLVASSNNKILGFFSSAREIAILCFWPPDSRTPRSPTIVLNPSGNWFTIKSYAFDSLAASIISFSVTSSQP